MVLVETFLEKGPTSFFEEEARARGYRLVAGLDEAGRGPLAGPVVGAAVVLPRRIHIPRLDDSKQLRHSQREELFDQILTQAVAWGIGLASETEIDRHNILGATRLAWARAIQSLHLVPDFLVVDGSNLSHVPLPQRSIIRGDQLSLSIAAASILAKVHRDRFMEDYHLQYPWYNFHIHKGYPTPEHLELLDKFGPCEAHRRSFRPVRDREQVQRVWDDC